MIRATKGSPGLPRLATRAIGRSTAFVPFVWFPAGHGGRCRRTAAAALSFRTPSRFSGGRTVTVDAGIHIGHVRPHQKEGDLYLQRGRDERDWLERSGVGDSSGCLIHSIPHRALGLRYEGRACSSAAPISPSVSLSSQPTTKLYSSRGVRQFPDGYLPVCGGAAGSCTVTRRPPAGRGVRMRVPSCAWVMLLTIASPRPTPAWSVRMRLVSR
jgi:hypothetical protein